MTFRRIASISAAIVAVFVTGMLPAGALGHYRVSKSRWFFDGQAFDQPSGGREVDPITVFFLTDKPVTLNRIAEHTFRDWSRNPTITLRRLGPEPFCSGAKQWMRFRNYRDPETSASGYEEVSRDLTDTNLSTAMSASGCVVHYHMRLWDDLEHARYTRNSAPDTWAVGSIHHEHRVIKAFEKPRHKVDMDFDTAASKLRTHLNEHCSRQKWRTLPGAAGRRSGHKQNDGYLTLISLQHTPSHGGQPCPSETQVSEAD